MLLAVLTHSSGRKKVVGNAYLVLENLCLLPTQFLLLEGKKEKGQSGGSIRCYCANTTKKITVVRLNFRLLQKATPLSFILLYNNLKKTRTHYSISAIILHLFRLKHTRTFMRFSASSILALAASCFFFNLACE